MKFKATKKEMRESYDTIISIGYCNAQRLLSRETPIAYSAGTNGWSCDYYDVGGVLISTGYSPLNSKHAKTDYETIRAYDKAAQAIINSNFGDYKAQKCRLDDLLRTFIRECTH